MESKRKIIVGNWKMNPVGSSKALAIFKAIKKEHHSYKNIDVIVAVPSVYLPVLKLLASKRLSLAAQNVFYEAAGPFTGEMAISMLQEVGATAVIVGHSERRALGETNELINKKVKAALKKNILPILCIGESTREDDVWYLHAVKSQLEECLKDVKASELKSLVIAYEPLWAIGKDAKRVATPIESEEMAIYIRKVLTDLFGARYAALPRIIYGGSVDEQNAQGFLYHGGVDGLLPGRVSLEPKKFLKILAMANEM